MIRAFARPSDDAEPMSSVAPRRPKPGPGPCIHLAESAERVAAALEAAQESIDGLGIDRPTPSMARLLAEAKRAAPGLGTLAELLRALAEDARDTLDTADDIRAVVGARVRTLRYGMGWSQHRVASAVPMNAKHYGQVERGKKNITLGTLAGIARVLRVDPEDLLRGES